MPPTIPSKSMLPVPAVRPRVSVWSVVPSRVLANSMSPIPAAVSRATLPVSVTAVSNLMSSAVVVMSPAVLTVPAPSWSNAPPKVISPAAAIVSKPALVIDTAPAAPVLTVLLKVKALPLRSRPSVANVPRVCTAPVKVVVPVPAV